MMTKRPQIDNWFELVKEIIRDFSDLKFQKKAFNGQGNLWSSPTEMVALALDDCCVDEWLEAFAAQLPPILVKELTIFIENLHLLPRYSEQYPTVEAVLDTPQWKDIRQLSASILHQLMEMPDPQAS